MFRTVLISTFSIILFLFSFGQDKPKGASEIILPNKSKTVISNKFVSNLEYITYLTWIQNVQAIDYPEVLFEAFPRCSISVWDAFYDNNKGSGSDLGYLISKGDSLVRGYIFNPKYKYSPIIGITPSQANKYCKWLQDRYNETQLIKYGYLVYYDNQINEDCFVSDAYLRGQYESGKKIDTNAQWDDRILAPAFRLPSALESQLNPVIVNNVSKKTKFLKHWQQAYLKIDSDKYTLVDFLFSENDEIIDVPFDYRVKQLKELTLPNQNENIKSTLSTYGYLPFDITKHQDENHYDREKDSLGQMSYIIIGNDSEMHPVYGNHVTRISDQLPHANASFRWCYSSVIIE